MRRTRARNLCICELHAVTASVPGQSSVLASVAVSPAPGELDGKQTAGVVILNRYSHFSGSMTEVMALVVPHERSTCSKTASAQ